ncbi:MAG: acyl carrier protein [Gammaproteobacteria bacterium]|nr:acyl carrier protein [Gammaproteobacteria bacterium]
MSTNLTINAIVADVLSLDEDEVYGELTPEKAEYWDSLAHLTLATAIEEECGIKLTMDEVLSIESVNDMYTIVQKHLESQ